MTLFRSSPLARILACCTSRPLPPSLRRSCGGDGGQATAEYALVVLAAAAVGVVLVAWVTSGGGADRIGRLFAKVFDNIARRVA